MKTIEKTYKSYRMVSLDTASFNSGWAYFEAGIRKSYGVIKADG